MIDIYVAALPPVGVIGPLLGPARVYTAAKAAGFSVIQADFNLDFFIRFKESAQIIEWLNIDSFSGNESGLVDPFLDQAMGEWVQSICEA